MEGIEAALSIGTIFIYTGPGSFSAVSGNKLYRGSPLLCQMLQEQGADTFSMSFESKSKSYRFLLMIEPTVFHEISMNSAVTLRKQRNASHAVICSNLYMNASRV